MRAIGPRVANRLWLHSCRAEARRFRRSISRPKDTQERLLAAYLRNNRETEYGRRYEFASLSSVSDYQKAVPLTTFDDYGEAIEQIAQGQPAILTSAPVHMFEESSGSTTSPKLIPYTSVLKSEFQKAISPWIFDLYSHYPSLRDGFGYWSISPLTDGDRATPAGIPIGFDEDSAYLHRWGKYLVEATMAVPNAVKHIGDIDAFRYATLLFLLRQPGLRLISVWHPTYLSLLIQSLPNWWEDLVRDISRGSLTPPGKIDARVVNTLRSKLSGLKARAKELSRLSPFQFDKIWPKLSLISCWNEGAALPYAQQLAQQFPGVRIQGKGLLATEAFVSFPLVEALGSVLAITSHFFEFLPVNDGGQTQEDSPKLAHELETDLTYAVVVTTGGGFYRYQLRDMVKVVGFAAQTPCLQFLGKLDQVSDWFGEKLDENFVASALNFVFQQRRLVPLFAMLAPDNRPPGFRYTLYLELGLDEAESDSISELVDALDRELSKSFHYAYCRKLGQLASPRIVTVGPGAADIYQRACQSWGLRLGNIKPVALHKSTDWHNWFGSRGEDHV